MNSAKADTLAAFCAEAASEGRFRSCQALPRQPKKKWFLPPKMRVLSFTNDGFYQLMMVFYGFLGVKKSTVWDFYGFLKQQNGLLPFFPVKFAVCQLE
jgi:hypothetical protein